MVYELLYRLDSLINNVPENQKIFLFLIIYTLLIFIYAIFIWGYYKFLSKREILSLNLRKYNYSKHPMMEKVIAIILYSLEYLVILPFLVIFWFAILSLFLLVLSEYSDTQQILLISTAIIASTRITAYVNETLSEDIAKILPLTILVILAFQPSLFNLSSIALRFSQIPNLLNQIFIFLIFIFITEFILRLLYSISQFFKSSEEDED